MMWPWRRRDRYLSRPVRSKRFDLVPCGVADAFNISWRWTRDPEILVNLTFDASPRTRVGWFREIERPDNRDTFTHAIIPRGGRKVIGLHRIKLVPFRTASAEIVVHDRAWWGRDVFFETRSALMNHFFASERVEKFQALVHTRNFPSVFNYKKLGYRCAGTLRRARYDPVSETRFDFFIFEMLHDEWEAGKDAGK